MKEVSKITTRVIIFIILLITSFIIFENETGKTKSHSICCNNKCFNIEIANTPELRQSGLMYRESLGENEGMLFVFDEMGTYSFRMKNTLIPLAGVRLDSDLNIVDIIQMDPCKTEKCLSYKPQAKAQYVLEINQGIISEKGLLHSGDNCELILN